MLQYHVWLDNQYLARLWLDPCQYHQSTVENHGNKTVKELALVCEDSANHLGTSMFEKCICQYTIASLHSIWQYVKTSQSNHDFSLLGYKTDLSPALTCLNAWPKTLANFGKVQVCWSRLVVCCEVTLVQKAEFECGQLHAGAQVLEVETEALCQSLGLCALPQHSASAACDPRP